LQRFTGVHPGVPSLDFPEIARFIRGQAVSDALHVPFNGAGGNFGAGKYNDDNKDNLMVLAQRLDDGRKEAFAESKKYAVTRADVGWNAVIADTPTSVQLWPIPKGATKRVPGPVTSRRKSNPFSWMP
jgi:hypothetical protein